jgi:hypothetical protein
MLHLPPRLLLRHLGVSSSRRRGRGTSRALPNQRRRWASPPPLLLDAGNVRAAQAPAWHARNGVQTRRSSRHPGASIVILFFFMKDQPYVCWLSVSQKKTCVGYPVHLSRLSSV